MKKHTKKSGFTLIELMVVAIIVAILAAVAIPLMAANKDRAIATEGQAGISAFLTAAKVYYTEEGTIGTKAELEAGNYIEVGDVNGKYFDYGSYSGLGQLTYTEATGISGILTAETTDGSQTITLAVPEGTWTYTKN